MSYTVEYYKIIDLCESLNGLIVEVHPEIDLSSGYSTVSRFINDSIVFGDRQVILPVSRPGLKIHKDYLSLCDNPTKREFSSDNPYGSHVKTHDFVLESGVHVVCTEMESATIVTIRDVQVNPPRTIFSRTYTNHRDRDDVQDVIIRCRRGDVSEFDITFELKKICNEQNRETD